MSDTSKETTAVEVWRKYDAMEQRLSASLSDRMVELAQLRSGMKVLDIACGRGEPATAAARTVGAQGRVLGLDADAAVLQLARERADREGLSNIEFGVFRFESSVGIAQQHFDVVLSRWGLMYFDDPVHAMRIARESLVEDGLLVIAVWTDPDEAAFYQLPRIALSRLTAVAPVDCDRPGTFYYSDPDKLFRDLNAAGFKVHHAETVSVDVVEVNSTAELIAWGKAFGITSQLESLSVAEQKKWEREIVELSEAYKTQNNKTADDSIAGQTIRLGGKSLIVTASPLTSSGLQPEE